MEHKVIQSFICKNSRTLYKEGSLYFCNDEKRIGELAAKGYISKPTQKKAHARKKAADE